MKEKLTNIKNCVKEMIKTVLRPFWKVFKAVVKFLYDKPLLLNVLLSLALAVLLEEAGRQTFPLSAWGFITQKTAMFLYSAFIIFFSYSIVLGSEEYYPRLGYREAAGFGVEVPEGIPSANFMAIQLLEGAPALGGPVIYAEEFGL